MADNITAPGAGTLLAADDVGGVIYPRSKLSHGVDGAAVDASDTNPFPVKAVAGLSAATVVAGQVTAPTGTSVQLPSAVARRFRIRSLITNDTTAAIYLGPSGVTVANGFPLWPGDITPPLELSNLNVLRSISGTAGQVLAYLGEV